MNFFKKRIISLLLTTGAVITFLIHFPIFIQKNNTVNVKKEFFFSDGVGFKHIKFENFEIYDPNTSYKQYFLNDYGKKELIKRFLDTSIIGPEISALKKISLGNSSIYTNLNNGLYNPIVREIHINPTNFWQQNKELSKNYDSNETQKMRVEAIIKTLVHEYGHHLFNFYASSPTRLEESQSLKSSLRANEKWNKYFYDKFINIFYSDNWQKTSKNIWNRLSNTNYKDAARIQEFYSSAKDLFDVANNGQPFMTNDKKFINFGTTIERSVNGYNTIKNFRVIPNNKKEIDYYYSLSELATRKMILSTFKMPKNATQNKNAESLLKKLYRFQDNLLYENIKFSKTQFNGQNILNVAVERFFEDYVFTNLWETPSSQKQDPGKSDDYINLLSQIIGHKDYFELSFIASQSPWHLKNINYLTLKNDIYKSSQKIKIGGFLKEMFDTIGYIENNKFIKISDIEVYDFKIGYKNNLIAETWQNALLENKNSSPRYWFTKNFVDLAKVELLNKPLAFAKKDQNGKILDWKKLKTVKSSNKLGYANSYDAGMKINVTREELKDQENWWLVGNKNSTNDVIIKNEKWNKNEQ